MSVSVVIVNYNSGALLQRCLQCLSDQTVRPDKLIIVDNASDEALSLEVLDNITRAEVIRHPKNIGYGAAINLAVRRSVDSELFCALNPDAFPEPDWLEQLLNAASKYPNYGSFASLMINAEQPELIDGAGDVLHFSGIPYRRFHGRRLGSVELHQEPVFSPCGGAALYRTEAFNRAGGFDETFFMYVEDIDLGFRMNSDGARCLFVPEAVVKHVGSATTGYRSAFSVYHGHRNLIWSYFKNMPVGLLILTLPFHVLANLLTIIVYTLRGHPWTILKAKAHGIGGIGRMMAKRGKMRSLTIWSTLTWI